ncbi:DUF4214 domain-containing protein, partial [Pseudomonas umsongensis]|uniref:DUF4214 domain-containing protein n=2 Tax=Pseudomonas umsongensis TaxID=198618 RepID=UPI002009F55C
MTITQTSLAELYVSFFNRAPDSAGLAYWVDQLDKGALSLEDISKNWMSEQAEGLAKYPSTLTETDFITQIYQATLGRAPDAEGLAYWQDQLTNNSVGRDVFLAAVINGAKANSSAQGVLDAATLSNKATTGVAFADKGLNDLTLAAQVVASVNSNPDTLAAAQAVIKLVPATAADVTPALITLLSKTFESIINLNAKAPGEVGDLATYLTAVANQASGTTDLNILLTSVSATVTKAVTDSAALDNPETLAGDAVIAATPSTGGGDVPAPPTFTVAHSEGVITFGGTATGDIKVSIVDGTATFERGGLTATDKVADIAEMKVNLAAGQTLAVDSADVSAASGLIITGAGTFKVTEALSIAQVSSISFLDFTGTKTYTIEDSLENVLAAGQLGVAYELTDSVVDLGALTVAGVAGAEAAAQAIVAGASNTPPLTLAATHTILDSLENVLAAGQLGVAYELTDSVVDLGALTVAGVAGAEAAAQAIVAGASNTPPLTLAATHTILDSLENVLAAGQLGVAYELTDSVVDLGALTVAGVAGAEAAAQAIVAGASNTPPLTLAATHTILDSLENVLAAGQLGVAYELTDSVVDLGALTVAGVAGAEAAAQA